MPVINGIGVSQHTINKENGLGSILAMHMRIVKAIVSKGWSHPQYHWFDIYAGSGSNPDCPGSPLVFLDVANRIGINYHATFIEQNPNNVARLQDCIGNAPNVSIQHGDNAQLLPLLCGQFDGKQPRYGMIYSDPNGIPDFGLLSGVSRFPKLNRVDILIYLSGTSLKRVRHLTSKGLPDHLATINKSYWLVRDIEDTGVHQWTFLLGANWPDLPDYRKAGFYRADSDIGRNILHILSTTSAERKADLQPGLFDVQNLS